jgi:hypothetical protein
MLIAAGPRSTTNRDGKIKKARGITNFIGILAAISSALWYLFVLNISE